MRIFGICVLLLIFEGISLLNAQSVGAKQDTVLQKTGGISTEKTKKTSRVGFDNDYDQYPDNKGSVLPGESDGVVVLQDSLLNLTAGFKPNPNKAVIYSMIFPGLGQIYNRKYWKLPIVYGGFVGLTYAITWNGTMYNDYSRAYKDMVTGGGTSWRDFISDPNAGDNPDYWSGVLKRRKDNFRRNRDLAIICTVGFYALCMLDAYVDAQLYDFDITPDLSMRVEPVMYEPTSYARRTFGLQCSITF